MIASVPQLFLKLKLRLTQLLFLITISPLAAFQKRGRPENKIVIILKNRNTGFSNYGQISGLIALLRKSTVAQLSICGTNQFLALQGRGTSGRTATRPLSFVPGS